MATLPGALLAMWTAGCILMVIFFSILTLASLLCTLVPSDGLTRPQAFSALVFFGFFAGLFYIHVQYLLAEPQETPETPRTRDILLTVPEESSVNAQVTSGNNTVNIENL
jgi:hypothetical protein